MMSATVILKGLNGEDSIMMLSFFVNIEYGTYKKITLLIDSLRRIDDEQVMWMSDVFLYLLIGMEAHLTPPAMPFQ